jgi:HAE1 family hydrophobic/amphiphilic exporter-1
MMTTASAFYAAKAQTPVATPSPTPIDSPTLTPLPGVDPLPAVPQPNYPVQQTVQPPPLPDLTRLGVARGNPLPLSMNDAIRRALENNNDIQVARDDVRINETTLRSLQGIYDPVFTFSPGLTDITQSNSQPFSGAASSTIQSRTFQLNGQVVKQFGTGGGSYNFFMENQRSTSNTALFSPVYTPELGVRITQPLWRDRSIDRFRRDIRIQKKRLQQSDADFRRFTIDTITLVQRAYWDLVFALRDQQNRIANLNLTRESLRRVEAQISAGSEAPLARAEVLTELANRESDLLLATQAVSVAENTLKQLMLKDTSAPEWTAELMPTDLPAVDSSPVVLERALEDAAANRPELRRLRMQKEINDIDLQFFKNQTTPRIDFVSTLSLNGLAGTPRDVVAPGTIPLISGDPNSTANAFLLQQINIIRNLPVVGLGDVVVPSVITGEVFTPPFLIGGYGRAVRNLFTQNTHNVFVGLTIEIPFRNTVAEANLAGARIQTSQIESQTRSQEQVVVVEVRNAAQNVETSRRRVLSARTARENAELQLAGEQRLYAVGRSTTFLLFQRENTLANARNAEVRAETDYNKALADLQRATSTTLGVNSITIDSPTGP